MTAAALPDLLRQVAAEAPDRIAIQVDRGPGLTFGSWQRRSEALAGGLTSRGVRPGDRVLLSFSSSRWSDHAVAYVAVHEVGGVAVPVSPDLTDRELGRIVDDCRPALVVAPSDLAPRIPERPTVEPAVLEREGGDGAPRTVMRPSGPVEILYRSRPLTRPVAMSRSLADLAGGPVASFAPLAGASTWVHASPVGTLAGQDALHACLVRGTLRLTVLPTFEPDRVCEVLGRSGAAVLGVHPAAARALVDSDATGRHDLAAVAGLVLASGRAGPALLVDLAEAFPDADLLVVDVLGHSRQIDPDGRPAVYPRTAFVHDRWRPGAVGRPTGATTVRITDGDGRPLAAGHPGQVAVEAPSEGPSDTPRAIPTGDLGYLDERGFLYLTGRRDIVSSPSTTVSRTELERTLTTHPAVEDAAVVGLPGDRDADEPVAVVVRGSPVEASELQDLLRVRLGEDRTPDRIVFTEDLPRNRSGIVLRRELRRRLGVVPAESDRVADEGDPTRETVATAWRRVLATDDVDHDVDLFELGGDVLDAHAVLSLIEDATGVRVPLDDLLAAPTVAGLAAAVERGDPRLDGAVPVAFSQEGMLWHERFAPGCQNLPGLARRYRGPLDVEALRGALDEIVRRHAPLRTTFELRDGRLVQVVRAHRELRLPIRELGGPTAEDRDAEVARAVAEAGRRPFDLVADDLFVPTLLRLEDDDHVLVIRTHHSVFDDWSVGVFRRELSALYAAFAGGEPSPLTDLPLDFPGFVRQQRRRLAGPAGVEELSFWRDELAGAPFTTQLPVDDPQLRAGDSQGSAAPVGTTVRPEVHAGLHTLARRQHATPFMVLLTAFAVLVRRYTGQDDLLLSTVVANRNRTELEDLIGCFTKKVPLRLRLLGDPTFTEALTGTRGTLLEALAHQDLPFETVVQDVLGSAAAVHGLIPHLAIVFQGVTPGHELDLPGVETVGLETTAHARRTHFMAEDDRSVPARSGPPWGGGLYEGAFVIVSVDETEGGLSFDARGAFHGPSVRDLLDRLRTLLADVVADPTRRISELKVLDGRAADDVRELTSGRSEPLASSALRMPASDAPEAVAVSSPAETLSWGQLRAQVDRLAGHLQRLGVGSGDRIGISLGASVDAVLAALAAWHLGAAWVGLDPGDDDDRLRHIASDAGLALVVGQGPHTVRVTTVPGRADDAEGRVAGTPEDDDPDGEAVVFYGSGAASYPHGIVLDRRAVANLRTGLRGSVYAPSGAAHRRRVCLSSPPTGDGFLRQLVALFDGHTLHVAGATPRDDPSHVVSLLADGRVDLLDCTADELQALLGAGLQRALADREPAPTLPVLVVGTRGPVDPEVFDALRNLDGTHGHVLYGPPECAFAATIRSTGDTSTRPHVGRPLSNVTVRVLDGHGRPVPLRAVGALHLGGPSVARSVTGAPDGGNDELVGSGADAGGRLYRMSQRARCLPDGDLELLGSVDAIVDLRGFRVDPARISSVLADHPAVSEVDVTLERDGSGEPRLTARIAADGRPPAPAQLRAFLWARLPGYAWPSVVVWRPDARPGPLTHDPGSVPPRAPAGSQAEVLAAAWAETLEVDGIPADANYWQAFRFLEALARAREAGAPVPGEHVTRNRTIATLATDLIAERVLDTT